MKTLCITNSYVKYFFSFLDHRPIVLKNFKISYNKNIMHKTISRNPFVALCEYASLNNWCWKLFCTTCGHGAFKVAFSKLIQGQHPDNDSFWPNGKSNSDPLKEVDNYSDFWSSATSANQIKLAKIVAEAKISDIESVAKFPDWLGYIGLVLKHCSDSKARKIISDSFIPQFIVMTEDNKELNDYFKKMQSDNNFLSIHDLSRVESGKVNLDKPPIPLIKEIGKFFKTTDYRRKRKGIHQLTGVAAR